MNSLIQSDIGRCFKVKQQAFGYQACCFSLKCGSMRLWFASFSKTSPRWIHRQGSTVHCAIVAMKILPIFRDSVSVFSVSFLCPTICLWDLALPLLSWEVAIFWQIISISKLLVYFKVSYGFFSLFSCLWCSLSHTRKSTGLTVYVCVRHRGSHDRRTLGWPRWPAADTSDWSWCRDKCLRTGEHTGPLKRSQAEN